MLEGFESDEKANHTVWALLKMRNAQLKTCDEQVANLPIQQADSSAAVLKPKLHKQGGACRKL